MTQTVLDETGAIRERLSFMEMTPESRAAIRSLKTLVDRELPVGLDKFYAQVRRTPETAEFFSSDAHMGKARGAQIRHWVDIANGDFEGSYASNVRAVGAMHAKIGLEPRWYMGGYAIVLDHLIQAAVNDAFGGRAGGLFAKRGGGAEAFGKALGALAKAVLLDMELAISVYMEEAERAKQAAQAEAVAGEQKIVSERFGKVMAAVADKDLTQRITDELPAAYHPLRDDFNLSIGTLREALQAVGQSSASIDSIVGELTNAAEDLSRRTERQAASVEETAAALDTITATVRQSAQRAEEAGGLVAQTRGRAETSEAVVRQAISTMGEIETSSREIGSIIGVIDEIAFQTNLLALNAGVEAARAGDAGRGFAVVAQEVRALAQRSADAAKQIKTLITKSGEEVRSGVSLVGDTGAALQTIITDVLAISDHVLAIVDASREQSRALAEVNAAVMSIDQGTQQNAAVAEETSAATRNLAGEAEQLNRLLSSFGLEAAHLGDTGRIVPLRRRAGA